MTSAFFAWLMFSLAAHADQRWVEDEAMTLRLTGGLSTPGCDFSVSGPGPDATYVPNSPSLPLIGASYGDVGFSVQVPSQPDRKSVEEKGSSRIQDYQFRFFGHRDTHELIYQNFRGYSLEGWEDAGGARIQRPEMKVQTLAYNFVTAVSPGYFSNAVAYSQRGVQHRGGGSLMILASAGNTQIATDRALVPEFATDGRGQIADLRELNTYYAMTGLGYGYLQPIFTRFYAALSGYGGVGLGYQKAAFGQGGEWGVTNLHRVGLRFGSGYNYGNHVIAVQLIVDNNTTHVADGQVSQSTFNARLFYTYRLGGVEIPYLMPRPD